MQISAYTNIYTFTFLRIQVYGYRNIGIPAYMNIFKDVCIFPDIYKYINVFLRI